MDNNTQQSDNLFDLSIDTTARDYLKTAATWARIIAIIGFIGIAIMLIDIFIGSARGGAMVVASSVLMGSIFIIIALVLNIFLLRFANNTLAGLSGMSQVQFNEGVHNLSTYLKALGIIIIIVLALCVIFVLAVTLGLGMR